MGVKLRRHAGFSLIELVVIIAILGLLSVALLVPLHKLTAYARATTISGTNSTIRSTVALAMLKYAATGDSKAGSIKLPDRSILVNPGSGVPIGTYPGIGTALNFPSSQDNGLVVDYTRPAAVSFQLSRDNNNNCQVIYDGSTGITTLITTDC